MFSIFSQQFYTPRSIIPVILPTSASTGHTLYRYLLYYIMFKNRIIWWFRENISVSIVTIL